MIRINLSKKSPFISLDRVAAEFYKEIKDRLLGRISKYKTMCDGKEAKRVTDLIDAIEPRLKEIVTAEPEAFDGIIKDFKKDGWSGFDELVEWRKGKPKKKLSKVIIDMLDYSNIRKNHIDFFFQHFDLSACPYCNTQYLLRVQGNDKRSLCQLDHFKSKSKFPFLSVTLYNLVPVCSYCNHKKGDKEFNFNPYYQGIDDKIRFKFDSDSVVKYLINDHVLTIDIENLRNDKGVSDYISFTQLKQLYENHQKIAAHIYLRKIYYNKDRREEIKAYFRDKLASITDDEIDYFIVGNYIKPKHYNKQPLSKMTSDFWEDVYDFYN